MNDFKKGPRFSRDGKPGGYSKPRSDRPSFSGGFSSRRPPSRDGGYGDQSSEKFKANCSKCHKECEVPFRPNGKKPVYCRDCFVRDDGRTADFRSNDRGSDRGGDRFEKRSYEKPAYQAAPAAAVEDPRITMMQKELSVVHTKLDRLIASLQGSAYDSILAGSAAREEKKPVAAVKEQKVAKPAKKVSKPAPAPKPAAKKAAKKKAK